MNRRYFNTFYQLIRRDLFVFRGEYWGRLIDICLMLATTVLVFRYFMPFFGLDTNYGPFILVGGVASFGFFEVIGRVGQLIADLEGERTITYTMTLPLPSSLILCYFGVSWAIQSMLVSSLLLPLGKLLLFTEFDLEKISFFKLGLIFLMSHLFYGFFALWVASLTQYISSLSHLFIRVINPIYMFGAYFYSWQAAYQLSPVVGYLSLLNPLVYVMEGMRAAILGQQGYLPFWFSFFMLFLFTILCGYKAVGRLKLRLDCV